jgi:hypothetical protein
MSRNIPSIITMELNKDSDGNQMNNDYTSKPSSHLLVPIVGHLVGMTLVGTRLKSSAPKNLMIVKIQFSERMAVFFVGLSRPIWEKAYRSLLYTVNRDATM